MPNYEKSTETIAQRPTSPEQTELMKLSEDYEQTKRVLSSQRSLSEGWTSIDGEKMQEAREEWNQKHPEMLTGEVLNDVVDNEREQYALEKAKIINQDGSKGQTEWRVSNNIDFEISLAKKLVEILEKAKSLTK